MATWAHRATGMLPRLCGRRVLGQLGRAGRQLHAHAALGDSDQDRVAAVKDGFRLYDHLQARVQVLGPLSVGDYMKECLTNPLGGYYMKGDVFGSQGDFVTSPEISQMFGELVGIWMVAQWLAGKHPKDVRLVELGPGRGTLLADVVRVLSKFPEMESEVSLHLVEASAALSDAQEEVLTGRAPAAPTLAAESGDGPFKTAVTDGGMEISWYRLLEELPTDGHTLLVAHEFFDALPIQQLEMTADGWRERLVDLAPVTEENPYGLQFVLAPEPTAPVEVVQSMNDSVVKADEAPGERMEVSLDAWRVCRQISKMLSAGSGGSALIMDYGEARRTMDTFRAFRKHKEVHVFDEPGSADLTADVNFLHLRHAFESSREVDGREIKVYGPATQHDFLKAMGIDARLSVLAANSTPAQIARIRSDAHRLTGKDAMGLRYKALAVTGNVDAEPPPAFA